MDYQQKPRKEFQTTDTLVLAGFYAVEPIKPIITEITREVENPVLFQCSCCEKRFGAFVGLIEHMQAGCPKLYPQGKPVVIA